MGSDTVSYSKLSLLCNKIGSGATPRGGSSVYLEHGEYTLIRSQNIYNNTFSQEGLVYITQDAADKLIAVTVEAKDVLLNITGDSVARCCQVDEKVLPARVNQHVAIIRPVQSLLDPQYLRYFLVSPKMQYYMLSLAGSGGTRNALTKGMIENFEIPIRPLSVQKLIAHILGTLDDKIELNRRMNATLEAMAQALFKSWFVDFDPVIDKALTAGNPIPDPLRKRAEIRQAMGDKRKPLPEEIQAHFPDHFVYNDEMGWVPGGWSTGPVSQLCIKIQNGGTPKRDKSEYWKNGTIPWLTSGEVRQTIISDVKNMITEQGFANSSAKWLPAFSTVVAMYGATAGQVSFISLPLTTNQAVCGLIPKKHYSHFVYLALHRLVSRLANQARGSAQQNINKKIIEETRTIIPPTSIGNLFCDMAENYFTRWIHNLKVQGITAKLRDTLLPKLLSGQLRIPDAEKLVEDAI